MREREREEEREGENIYKIFNQNRVCKCNIWRAYVSAVISD